MAVRGASNCRRSNAPHPTRSRPAHEGRGSSRASAARCERPAMRPSYRGFSTVLVQRSSHFLRLSSISTGSIMVRSTPSGSGTNLRIGRRHVALGHDLLALADHEIVEQQRRVRMRRAARHRRAVAERDHRLEIERLDRRAVALLLLGLVAVDRERERHFARLHQIGKQRVAAAHRHAVGLHDVAEELQALLLAHLHHDGAEPVEVRGLDRKPSLPARIEQVLVASSALPRASPGWC